MKLFEDGFDTLRRIGSMEDFLSTIIFNLFTWHLKRCKPFKTTSVLSTIKLNLKMIALGSLEAPRGEVYIKNTTLTLTNFWTLKLKMSVFIVFFWISPLDDYILLVNFWIPDPFVGRHRITKSGSPSNLTQCLAGHERIN